MEILPAQFSLSLNDDGRTALGRLMLVGESTCEMSTVTWEGATAAHKQRIEKEGTSLRLKRDLKHARETVSAPQSTAASAAGIQATLICGGFFG